MFKTRPNCDWNILYFQMSMIGGLNSKLTLLKKRGKVTGSSLLIPWELRIPPFTLCFHSSSSAGKGPNSKRTFASMEIWLATSPRLRSRYQILKFHKFSYFFGLRKSYAKLNEFAKFLIAFHVAAAAVQNRKLQAYSQCHAMPSHQLKCFLGQLMAWHHFHS